MLNQRQYDIIKLLLSFGSMTIAQIAQTHKISRKTVYEDIDMITFCLEKTSLGVLVKQKNRIELVAINEEGLEELLVNAKRVVQYYDIKQRQALILLMLLQQPNVTIDTIVRRTDLSKSTISNDIQKIKQKVKKYGVILSYDNFAYCFSGNEIEIRGLFVNMLAPYAQKLLATGLVESKFFQHIRMKLSGYSLLAVDVAHLAFHVWELRLQHGKTLTHADGSKLLNVQVEWNFLLDKIGDFPFECSQKEKLYSMCLIKSFFRVENREFREEHIIKVLEYMCYAYQSLTGKYIPTDIIYTELYQHFQPAYYRLQLKIVLQNPIYQQIIKNHPSVFSIIELSLNAALFYQAPHLFVEHEASYLTILLLTYDMSYSSPKDDTIVIACYEGISISQSLKQQLIQMGINPAIMKCVSFDQLEDTHGSTLITTIAMNEKFSSCFQKKIVVSPILTAVDKVNIAQKLQLRNDISAVHLMQVMQKHLDAPLYQKIINEARLQEDKGALKIGMEDEIMLSDLLTTKTIQVMNKVSSWEDAVNIAAKPLLETAKITEEYIEQVIANITENGAYIVLKDGFALPHARPSEAVKEISMSLLVLENPIYFAGNSSGVHIVVLLAAIDNESHLQALSELIMLMGDDVSFEAIKAAKSIEQIIKIINQGKEEV